MFRVLLFIIGSSDPCNWFLKKAAAEVNKEFGLDANVAENIMKAADEVRTLYIVFNKQMTGLSIHLEHKLLKSDYINGEVVVLNVAK